LLDPPLRVFLRLLGADLRKEHVADHADDQMTFQSQKARAFVGNQAEFLLLVLKAPFDMPSMKGHQQQCGSVGYWSALLTKYFNTLSSTWHATSNHSDIPAKSSLLLSVARIRFTSQKIGPF